MARLWARTTTFESLSCGDQLPILVKWETAATIARFTELAGFAEGLSRETPVAATPQPAADAAVSDEFTGPVPPQALVAYVIELLEKGFLLPTILSAGSSLTLRTLAPVQAEDTISLSGQVVDKRRVGELALVECLVLIENQKGERVGEATAVIAFRE